MCLFISELYEREVEGGKKVIYWNVNYPFPMSKRDVSFTNMCTTKLIA